MNNMSISSIDNSGSTISSSDPNKIRMLVPGTFLFWEWMIDQGGVEGFYHGIQQRKYERNWIHWYMSEGMAMCGFFALDVKFPGMEKPKLYWRNTVVAPRVWGVEKEMGKGKPKKPAKPKPKPKPNPQLQSEPSALDVDGDQLQDDGPMDLLDFLDEGDDKDKKKKKKPVIKVGDTRLVVPTLLM
jgi:hypothetical protein